ncbi:MAG: heme ABC transporter ATP-binding protein [Marinobacterium sp.]|nr:heme ABC transporter ATP-binding protein [Marinobacterium sp.]
MNIANRNITSDPCCFSATHVSLHIGTKVLLDRVTLALQPGQVLALLGPNGAGKSTFMKLLAGEFAHFAGDVCGDVVLNGRPWADWPRDELARIVGVLPQHSELAFPFSVAEVVALGRLPHSTGRRRDNEIMQQALKKVDGWHLRSAAYPSLSGGEKQRVQLARVLAQIWDDTGLGPRYLLLDEPTSALDLAHQHQTLALAREWAEQQDVAVLAILHDMNLAARYADQVGLLEQGRLIAAGPVAEVMTAERLTPLFGIEVSLMQHPEQNRPLIIAG